MSFDAQIRNFAQQSKARLNLAVGYVVADLAQRLDRRSPVGDPSYWVSPPPPGYRPGAFRGNWQLGVGSVPQGETGRIDPTGATTVAAIIAEIPTEAAGKMFYLANNRPYARRLEDGWSPQAPPGGIVGLTALEFPQVVRAAVARAQQ